MRENFKCDTSYSAWELFKRTGNIGYYMLYSNLEHPPKELIYIEESEREM